MSRTPKPPTTRPSIANPKVGKPAVDPKIGKPKIGKPSAAESSDTQFRTPGSSPADTRSFGFTDVPADEKQRLVDGVFAKVAKRYDVMNDVMSFGVHRVWKDLFVAKLPLLAGSRSFTLLDVAGGTGDIAFRALKGAGPNARAIVCDISEPMLREGARRAAGRRLGGRIDFVQGNAEALPVSPSALDAYTIAFGIRNVPRHPQGPQRGLRGAEAGRPVPLPRVLPGRGSGPRCALRRLLLQRHPPHGPARRQGYRLLPIPR